MGSENYTQIYGADEASEVTVDLVIKIGVAVLGFASLIALIWVIGYLKKKIPKF